MRAIYKLNLALLLIILISCSDTSSKYERPDNVSLPDMVQDNYNHYIYKNNRKYLHTLINKAEFYEKEEKIICNTFFAEVFNSKGEKTTEINSNYGNINQKSNLLEFKGSVIIKSFENKTTLYTEQLFLDYKNNKMYNSVAVSIEKDDGSYLKATSMTADIRTEESNYTNMEIKYYYDSDSTSDDAK